ncbi:MAG: glycosyltransferase family 2 protein [Bacteroidales bacterium]|nr:glycosyltransferase family 2 protein [Bacteroidales bacterium]
MKVISIIVPMYNVAPYVEKCIRSLENQDIPKTDYEIICINDGSPDNCKDIVESLQKEFANIILIDQQNQGVSKARNNGIDKAIGKYILFIDPDDYVEENSFCRIIAKVEKYNAQVSFLGYTFLNEDGSIRSDVFNLENSSELYVGIDAYFIARGDSQTDPDRLVGVIFERNLLNIYELRYLPNVPFLEDGELIARLMCVAKRCIFDGHSFYRRTTRRGSATNSNLFYTDRAVNGFLLAVDNLIAFKNRVDLEQEQRNFLNQAIAKFVTLPFVSAATALKFKTGGVIYKKLVERGVHKLDTDGCNYVFARIGIVFNKGYIYFMCFWKFRTILCRIKNFLTIRHIFILEFLYSGLGLYNRYLIRK